MTHQIHFGKKFYLDKKTGYWISTTCPKIRAHIFVWKNFNGLVPKGYHIHHKDFNKSNNDIENLQLMNSYDHLSLHASLPLNKIRLTEQALKVQHLTKTWHSSEKGRKWHQQHAINKKFGKNKITENICNMCSGSYTTYKISGSKFCSNNCKSNYRRKLGLDDVKKICLVCNEIYIINKYSRSKTCGRTCGGLFKSKKY